MRGKSAMKKVRLQSWRSVKKVISKRKRSAAGRKNYSLKFLQAEY